MTIDRHSISIQGSGPYGFRLAGGDAQPLTVTKLRKQSKACDAGLQEGDFLLGINGFECRSMSHSSAMALLENTEHSLDLDIYRGSADNLEVAYSDVSSQLRPLSPGSIPPPRLLPPPPPAHSGDLVIDQPSFLRRHWPQQKPADNGVHSQVPARAPPPPPGLPIHQPSYPPLAEPRVLDECPPQPLPATDAALPTFHVSMIVGDAKQPWTPYPGVPWQQQPAPAPVRQAPSPSPADPAQVGPPRAWMWQPTETPQLVRSHEDVNLDPEPLPETHDMTQSWPTAAPPPHGAHGGPVRLGLSHHPHPGGHGHDHTSGRPERVEMIPRWALPLRSEYDWRDTYYWADDGEEWELADDGQFYVRRRTVFADSSFYEEPEHKYPSLEEQIKMARKVAQSLTAPGNVKARGQRMFLRRREKADRWTIDELHPQQNFAQRRAAVARAAHNAAYASELSESEAEVPYYNPTPWMAARVPSAAAAAATWQPPRAPSPPAGVVAGRWQPSRGAPHAAETTPTPPAHALPHPVALPAGMSQHTGNVPPQVAFGLANDLAKMRDKGGRLFAKFRARAAAEETEDDYGDGDTMQAARHDVMRRIADSYVPPARHELQQHDVIVNGTGQQATATRLLQKIERERSKGIPTAVQHIGLTPQPTHAGAPDAVPVAAVSFTAKHHSAGFKPVRFKAPLVVGAADAAAAHTVADTAVAVAVRQDDADVGISDF